MEGQIELEAEKFDELLNWFSANRDEAGQKYEEIRKGLVRFFYFKGCGDAESLADKTFNRVAGKLSVLDLSANVKPASIFHGFASKIYLEYLNNLKKREIAFNADLHTPFSTEDLTVEAKRESYKCLEKCLGELIVEDRQLIVEYYDFDKENKIEHRKKMIEKSKMKPSAFQVKIFRLRNALRKCVEKCAA